ncbi:MAG: GumC family protein, partial [Bryobacteraceae bacterium]
MSKELLTTTPDWVAVPATRDTAVLPPEFLAEPQSGSIIDYWRALARSKKVLAICSTAGLALGLGVAFLQPAAYRANSSLEIQDVKTDASKILSPTPETAATDPLADIQTQIKILQSRTLMENALSKLNIKSERGLAPHADERSIWTRFFESAPTEDKQETLVEKALKSLKVTESGQTRIVDVSFEGSDPALAARLVNALTAEYIEQNLKARWEINHRTSEWLGGQLDEQRAKLRQSEDALQAYARQKGLMYTGEKQSVSEEKLRQLQAELSKAQADLMEKQSRSEIARAANLETVPEILNDNNLRSMESTLTDLRRQEAQLGVTFKPDYTKAKQLRAEIQALEAAVGAKRKVIADRIDNELQESQRREQLLSAAYARQTHVVTDDSEKSIQYDMLKHEVDTNRQIYQAMLQRVKESTIASAMKITNVRILDPAKPPNRPDKPNFPVNAGAGLMAGLVLSIMFV